MDGATEGSASGTLPFEGTLTIDDYDWISDVYTGIVHVDLPSRAVRRFLSGRQGTPHPGTGSTVFVEGCGENVGRVAIADERGTRLRTLTPCSAEVDNPGFLETNFVHPALSPDGSRLAVESTYFQDQGYRHRVLVYDAEGNAIASQAGWDPSWTPEGRLLVGHPDGLYLSTDASLETFELVGAEMLAGEVFGPKAHPTAPRALFEFNQRLWEIDLDGTNLREVAYGSARLSSPSYSPEGDAIAFVAQEFEYNALLWLKRLDDETYYSLDVRDDLGTSGVPSGPLSWTR